MDSKVCAQQYIIEGTTLLPNFYTCTLCIQLFMRLLMWSIATITSAKDIYGVNPNSFRCGKYSSVNNIREWSTGYPPVSMTHIFCGQINKNKAEGFHARPNSERNYVWTEVGKMDRSTRAKAIHCYFEERVFDANANKWISRRVPPSGHFCFFPESWSIKETVTNIQAIFSHCQNEITPRNTICGRNYQNMNFDVIIFLRKNGAQRKIVSSFATLPQEYTECETNCDLRTFFLANEQQVAQQWLFENF